MFSLWLIPQGFSFVSIHNGGELLCLGALLAGGSCVQTLWLGPGPGY